MLVGKESACVEPHIHKCGTAAKNQDRVRSCHVREVSLGEEQAQVCLLG